MNKNF
jgi:hypothetical protein